MKKIKDLRITNQPDKWVVVKIERFNTETVFKVFATWAGGYGGGDAWRLNSGIAEVLQDDNTIYFVGHSGSTYACNKKHYGIMSSYGHGVLDKIISDAEGVGFKISIVEENEILTTLLAGN
jgi:hypothetical protein